jgi:predicted porin
VKYKANGFDVGIGYNRGTNMDGTTGLITSTAGGSYAAGDFKFFAGYQAMKNDNSILLPVFYDAWDKEIGPSLKSAGVPAAILGAWTSVFRTTVAKNFKLDATSFSLGLQYKVGNGRIMTSFSRQDDRTVSNSDVSQIAIGYDYNLSKRTDLYTVFGRIKNQNDGQYALGAASASGGFTETPGGNARANWYASSLLIFSITKKASCWTPFFMLDCFSHSDLIAPAILGAIQCSIGAGDNC